MSDFDDEPIEDIDDIDGTDEAEPPAKPRRKPRPQTEPDDDWDDDWDDDDDDGRGGGKRDLTLVYAIVAAAIVIVLAVVLTRPKDDNNSAANNGNGNGAATTQAAPPQKNWQGAVGDAVGENGKDAQARAESGPGVYIWTDFGGWHLRNNGTAEATVKVAADQVKEGDGEFATEMTVTLPAGNGAEGVDLDLGTSESATFTVQIDGADVPKEQIFLGGAEGVADDNPVTVVKS